MFVLQSPENRIRGGRSAAPRAVVPAGLPAVPAQRDPGVRGELVEDRPHRLVAVLERPVVGGGLRVRVPGVVDARIGLELGEQADVQARPPAGPAKIRARRPMSSRKRPERGRPTRRPGRGSCSPVPGPASVHRQRPQPAVGHRHHRAPHPRRQVYCAVVLDACSRRVVGWSIDATPTAALGTTRSGWRSSPANRPEGR